jgi:predicted RecA/RadA family phage recombinase
MKNYEHDGIVLPFTAPSGGVTSGVGYQIGQAVVVATATKLINETFEGVVRGVVDVAKPQEAWASQGLPIYYDASAKKFTTTSTGNRLVGCNLEVVGSGATELVGVVYLDGAIRLDEAT